MKQRMILLAFAVASSQLIFSAFAANVLPGQWNDKEVVTAREVKLDLLTAANGFEASGEGPLARARLPVRGVLPSELAAVFEKPQSGFESAPTVPQNFKSSDLKVTGTTLPSGLQYSISYENITDGLDAICTGTRIVHKISGDSEKMEHPNSEGSDFDEVHSASASINKFGIPYTCQVYCSVEVTFPYCSDTHFVERMISKSRILAPGNSE